MAQPIVLSYPLPFSILSSGGIDHNIRNLMSKDRSGGKYLLERIESIIIGGVELPRDILPGEVYK